MNTITIELCKEDRQRLDNIFYNLVVLIERLPDPPIVVDSKDLEEQAKVYLLRNGLIQDSPKVEATAVDPASLEPTPVVEDAPAPVAEPAPEVKPVSLAEFQKAVTLAVSKGAEAKQAVKAIINKYAASVSAVPEDKRADIIAELANI